MKFKVKKYKDVKVGDILTIKTSDHMHLHVDEFVDNKSNKYYKYRFVKEMQCIQGHKVVVTHSFNYDQVICNHMRYTISASMIQEFQNDDEIEW